MKDEFRLYLRFLKLASLLVVNTMRWRVESSEKWKCQANAKSMPSLCQAYAKPMPSKAEPSLPAFPAISTRESRPTTNTHHVYAFSTDNLAIGTSYHQNLSLSSHTHKSLRFQDPDIKTFTNKLSLAFLEALQYGMGTPKTSKAQRKKHRSNRSSPPHS